jgi:hypothetical protein
MFGLVYFVSMARPAHAESALVVAAREVAHDLGPVPATALVIASPLTIDVAAPRGDELAARMASLLAAAVAGNARAAEHPMSLPMARTRASATKAGALVYLDVRVESGELRLTADVYPVVANPWDRVRTTAPPPSAHAFAHVPVGAEVRSYLPPLHLERAHLAKFTHDAGAVLAIACGNLDGKGDALVLVTAREVLVGALAAGRFVVARHALASSIGRRAPVPFREPLATAVIARDAGLYVGWGDRTGAVMGADLVPRAAIVGLPVSDGTTVTCVAPDAARGGFADTRVDCTDGKTLSPRASPMVADAWAALDLDARLVAAHEPSGTLRLMLGREALVVNDVGAQLALGDLDQDGVPEVITTSARGEDALVVSSVQKGGLAPRLRWAAPAGVDAVAVCPADVDDAPSVVAAVGGELWLVH